MLATTVVRMLQHPEKISNHAVRICGVRNLTQQTLKGALEIEMGLNEGFEILEERVDAEALKREALEFFKRGEKGKGMKGLPLWAQFGEGGGEEVWDNGLVGVEMLGVREAVREVLENL